MFYWLRRKLCVDVLYPRVFSEDLRDVTDARPL